MSLSSSSSNENMARSEDWCVLPAPPRPAWTLPEEFVEEVDPLLKEEAGDDGFDGNFVILPMPPLEVCTKELPTVGCGSTTE